MSMTEYDLQLCAGRLRAHFLPPLQDAAEELAFGIARWVGPEVKLLQPEMTLTQILAWMEPLDVVAAVFTWEEECGDDFSEESLTHTTFRDLVQRVATQRRSRR